MHLSHSYLVAGFGLLLMAVLSPIGFLTALPNGSLTLAGVIALLVGLLDIAVAVALFYVTRSGGKNLALSSAILRIIYAIALLGAGVYLLIARDADSFNYIWDRALLLFGIHLFLMAASFYRSAELPTWVGVLLFIAGVGYVADALAVWFGFTPGFEISTVSFFGEVVLIVWLLWKGVRMRRSVVPRQ
ncbi:DUF4386 domain-containing protein [Corynebacterium lubricantis]|uniref:DUF4386 domain-containing protein n=1 Tax=Corynebacterium lubricantis TaxID=541095 RepID=UPI000378E1BF|nr:DUF4386 domain-containing protein [Corynebacterium lubricantis]